MGTLGLHPDFSHICVYDYSSFFALVRPEEQIKFHSDGNFRLSPDTEIYGSFSYSEQESSRGNSLYPDVRYVIVPERHFGVATGRGATRVRSRSLPGAAAHTGRHYRLNRGRSSYQHCFHYPAREHAWL